MMQLLRGLNKQMDRQIEARKRNFAYHAPVIVPIWPQVCLNFLKFNFFFRLTTLVGSPTGSSLQHIAPMQFFFLINA